ncbi:BLUF domain-containing protein [Piscinibacter sp. HJYY11]|uniref:BLUF domain-containing protein n=1 Tax=Piscinibacter sp. HJYY11 TaxID=2801333 RepID=UPI0019201898|nr:BLUF domain-containing protein [Piscinibacter sp. HJYY11]MBL0730795.1 BLUF domain-containing protein [Piscinibacter sp. HJYY11]
MHAPLHHIVYISRSLATPLEVEDILARARPANAGRGLTGSLVFTGGHFAQWLEGPAGAVADTLAAITADTRHEAVRTLREGKLPARRFAAWQMAFAEAPGTDDLLASLLASSDLPQERIERLLERLFKP